MDIQDGQDGKAGCEKESADQLPRHDRITTICIVLPGCMLGAASILFLNEFAFVLAALTTDC